MIEQEIDKLEETVFQLDIISSFEFRGWGLYRCEDSNINEMSEIADIISNGREKHRLEYGERYILLPLSSNDSDIETVLSLVEDVLHYSRGPFFIEFTTGYDDGEKWIEPVGAFFVDSIILEPPNLILVIEPNLSRTAIPDFYNKDAIEISLTELDKIRSQLMMSLR